MEDKVVKTSKFIKYTDVHDTETYESDSDHSYIDKELLDEEYYENTIDIIRRSLLGFSCEKSLPLCEYLSCNMVNNFVSKNFNI